MQCSLYFIITSIVFEIWLKCQEKRRTQEQRQVQKQTLLLEENKGSLQFPISIRAVTIYAT